MQLSDGYADLPAGKIANVVVCLEMRQRAAMRAEPPGAALTLERIVDANVTRYRAIYRSVGERYLWFSRLTVSVEQLAGILGNPDVEIYAIRCDGTDRGLLELDFRVSRECELTYFGVSDALVGKGVGRWAMNRAIEIAWSHPIERFWLHTCSLDHPKALDFYVRSGFRPFKRQIEIADDPRLSGALPRDAAPHVPLL
jgi:GNAT superfamily N-acetyltransferase